MHKLQMYEGLRDLLEREVSEIEKSNTLDGQTLDHLYKLMMSIKCTDKCIERENGGTSQGSYGRMSNGSYGSSYARRGRDGDGDGRYNESRGESYRGSYRSEGSYGESRDKMVQKLEAMMDEAKNEHERRAIMECLDKL